MQTVLDRFGRTIKRLIAPALLGIVVLLSATPVLAADPADYLDSMPAAAEVMATFTGSNALDTAAQQYAALERLDQLMGALTADHTMTTAEKALKDSYYNSPGWVGLVASVQASLPEDQRPYESGTRFAEWRALVDHYRADSGFNTRFRSLFPAAFTTAFSSQLRELEAGGKTPSLPPPTTIAPVDLTTLRFPIVIASLFVGMAIFALLLKRARLEIDKQNPFRLHVGSRTYDLRHVTGVASGVSKMSTTRVFGSGGADGAPVSVGSYSTVHDQFFVATGGGHKESVQLAGWDFPVDNDHLVSAVSMGDKGYLLLTNHTTNDHQFNWDIIAPNILRRGATTYQVIELAVIAAIAYPASLLIDSYLYAFVAAFCGIVAGSIMWHYGLKGGYFSRFRKNGLPRLKQAVDDESRRVAPAQA